MPLGRWLDLLRHESGLVGVACGQAGMYSAALVRRRLLVTGVLSGAVLLVCWLATRTGPGASRTRVAKDLAEASSAQAEQAMPNTVMCRKLSSRRPACLVQSSSIEPGLMHGITAATQVNGHCHRGSYLPSA